MPSNLRNPMAAWEKESQFNRHLFLLRIIGGYLEALFQANYKVVFRVRNAKVKIFLCGSTDVEELSRLSDGV